MIPIPLTLFVTFTTPLRQKKGLQTYQPNFSSKCVIWIPNIVGGAQISQPLNQTVRVKMCGKNH